MTSSYCRNKSSTRINEWIFVMDRKSPYLCTVGCFTWVFCTTSVFRWMTLRWAKPRPLKTEHPDWLVRTALLLRLASKRRWKSWAEKLVQMNVDGSDLRLLLPHCPVRPGECRDVRVCALLRCSGVKVFNHVRRFSAFSSEEASCSPNGIKPPLWPQWSKR